MRNRVFLTAAVAMALSNVPASAAPQSLPPYAEAMKCAALSHAALTVGKGTPQESQLFDNLIYWGMAAADSGRAAGKASKAVDTEVERESGLLQPKLRAQDGATVAGVADCARRVPALDK